MHFNNVNEAFKYIESFTNLEKKTSLYEREYRLDRMKALLELFDNPQNSFKTIHVAGSKGKGSTSAFIASILKEAGFKTGLYESPHILSYKERITLAGRELEDSIYINAINNIKDIVENLPDDFLKINNKPTTFELLTVLAFNIFREINCSWVVLETGLGGRLDATNVVIPELSVITPIEKEHSIILGDTLDKIASEKAGIIKTGKPVVCASQKNIVTKLLSETAKNRNSEILFYEDFLDIKHFSNTKKGNKISFLYNGSIINTKLKLLGDFQIENAGLALLCIKKLFPYIKNKTIKKGLYNTSLSGRMEVIKYKNRYLVLDGAHTPVSVQRILNNFSKVFFNKTSLIFGSVLDKDFNEMANILAAHFKNIYISTPGYFKESSPETVYNSFNKINNNTELIPDPEKALETAVKNTSKNSAILITGSFYLVAEIKKLLI